jgi:hypothetical protein
MLGPEPTQLAVPLLSVVDEERSAALLPSPQPPRAAGFMRRAAMPLEDELFMSPWAKWRVYRHPPLKMIAHLLLILVATPTIMLGEWQKVSFLHDLRLELVRLYFPPRCRPHCLDEVAGGARYCQLPPHCAFSLVDDVTSFVGGVVDGYYTSKARLVPRVDFIRPRDNSSDIEPVHLRCLTATLRYVTYI